MRHDSVLKAELTTQIENFITNDSDFKKFAERIEVQRVSPLVIQVKAWEENGPPRYLNIHVKELM
jgi:hypothetical protein